MNILLNKQNTEKLKLIFAMLVFGSIGLFVRYIRLSSATIALFRGVTGVLFLLLAGAATRKKLCRDAVKNNLLLLILSGIAIGGNWILLFQAYRYTTISTATLCYYLAPVIVVIASPFLLKERLTPAKGCCILTALMGMTLVADIFNGPSAARNIQGIAYGTGAAVLYAGVVILNKFLKNITALDSTIIQLAASSIVLLPYVLLTQDWNAVSLNLQEGIMLLLVGILHTGLCYFLYFGAIQQLPAQTAAVLSYIDPVTAIVLSTLFLQEPMSLWQTAGAVLILGSTLASELLKPGKEKS